MNILVTGQMSHLTKQVVKRLQDAGHQIRFSSNANSSEFGTTVSWIIKGSSALSLSDPNLGYRPLRSAIKEMAQPAG